MQHAGDRPARAGAHIGGGAGDGAGDADAAEQRRGDIGDALRHQLAVRAMAPPGHAVGDHGRQQRLRSPPAARRPARRAAPPAPWRDETAGRCGTGRHRGNAAEAAADRLHRQPRSAHVARPATTTAISMPGQCGRSRLSADDEADREHSDRDRGGIDRVGSARARAPRASGSVARLLARRASGRDSSLIWLAKMMTAMPAVKPTVTG